jgi:hypothetical protein
MHAVWSFWSKPFAAYYQQRYWRSEKHHLLSWVLSVELGRRHYGMACLFTDDQGARMLVDGLQLNFDRVSIALNALDGHDLGWWVLGKLYTYRAQQEPFIHLDSDVFLWSPLPAELTAAAVFAQNPEHFYFEDQSLYRVDPFMAAMTSLDGWLPGEWWTFASLRANRAVCCGVLGANRVDFIQHYAQSAIQVIEHARNQRIWPLLGIRDNIILEQYFLAGCLEYHRHKQGSPFEDVEIRYLFESAEHAFDGEHAARAGFTHLIGDAKCDAALTDRLERRVQQQYPETYERVLRYLAERSVSI